MSLINQHEVCRITGLSRFTIRRLELTGKFPKRVKLSERRVAWRSAEITEWLNTRVAV